MTLSGFNGQALFESRHDSAAPIGQHRVAVSTGKFLRGMPPHTSRSPTPTFSTSSRKSCAILARSRGGVPMLPRSVRAPRHGSNCGTVLALMCPAQRRTFMPRLPLRTRSRPGSIRYRSLGDKPADARQKLAAHGRERPSDDDALQSTDLRY
jgi:hypothetical protein